MKRLLIQNKVLIAVLVSLNSPPFLFDQMTARIRSVIAADVFLIRIHLAHIFRSIWIILKRRQASKNACPSPEWNIIDPTSVRCRRAL